MRDGSMVVGADEEIGVASARRIAARLEEDPGLDVCVDFTKTRTMAPGALGVIAEALARRSGMVTVVGLSSHELRILRYLGIRLPDREMDPLA